METRSPNFRSILLPLVFIAICVVLALTTWRLFGGSVPFQAAGYRVSVTVPHADALFPNTDVRIAGVSVGRVRHVAVAGRHARVELEIDPEFAPLRRDARVLVRSKTLLGEGFLEVAPGDPDAPLVPDGGTLAQKAGAPKRQRLEDVLSTFGARTRRQLRELFAGTATAFAGRSGALNDALGRIDGLRGDLDVVIGRLDDQGSRLTQLTRDAGTVFGALGRQQGAMRQMVRSGSAVMETTAARDRALRATIAELPPFLAQLDRSSHDLALASDDLRPAVAALRPLVPKLRPALASLRQSTPSFERAFRSLVPLVAGGQRGLPVVTDVARTATPALDPPYMAMRELIPIADLVAESRDSIVGSIANMASVFNPQVVTPTGKVQGSIAAWLTAWNEIVGGWTKKLPTNRSNPYPRPGSSEDIARGGLKAYDCRNVNNPLLLPALGTGAPDCKLQGPWTFRGKTAYYPRLQLDGP